MRNIKYLQFLPQKYSFFHYSNSLNTGKKKENKTASLINRPCSTGKLKVTSDF